MFMKLKDEMSCILRRLFQRFPKAGTFQHYWILFQCPPSYGICKYDLYLKKYHF